MSHRWTVDFEFACVFVCAVSGMCQVQVLVDSPSVPGVISHVTHTHTHTHTVSLITQNISAAVCVASPLPAGAMLGLWLLRIQEVPARARELFYVMRAGFMRGVSGAARRP